jgi:hypothetical protein
MVSAVEKRPLIHSNLENLNVEHRLGGPLAPHDRRPLRDRGGAVVTIVKKLVLKYGPCRTDESGSMINAHYFEFKGSAIWDPYAGIAYDENVDPRTYYGITLEQANQLCKLNGVYLPENFVV